MLRLICFSLLCLSSLFAHKIYLHVTDENGMIYLHSYFTKTSPCKQCLVQFLNEDRKEIASYRTNDEGKIAVKLPASKLIIISDGGMGHKSEMLYTATNSSENSIEKNNASQDERGGLFFSKIVFALVVIALFFGGLFWYKRKKQQI